MQFIVDGYNWGYGGSSYFCVIANSIEEAAEKVKKKLAVMSEDEKRKGDYVPCIIQFDVNGISQNLLHLW